MGVGQSSRPTTARIRSTTLSSCTTSTSSAALFTIT